VREFFKFFFVNLLVHVYDMYTLSLCTQDKFPINEPSHYDVIPAILLLWPVLFSSHGNPTKV
jgi:hypothetical protein